MNYIRTTLFLVFLSFPIFLNAQFDKYLKFKRIGERHGLSSNWVRTIHQDNQGFVWFGTADGLFRFDAYECKVYRPKNEKGVVFGDIHVNDIENNSNGGLWVSTDQGMFTFFNNELKKAEQLPLIGYTKMAKQGADNLWAIGRGQIFKYSSTSKKTENYTTNKNSLVYNKRVFSVFKDSQGDLWFGGKGQIFKYSTKNNSFEVINTFQGLDTTTQNDIIAITEDHSGKIWVGFGQNGLFSYQPSTKPKMFVKHSEGSIIDLIVDKDNFLWVAKGEGQGLTCLDLNNNRSVLFKNNVANSNSLSDSSAFSLLEDDIGDIWIGTFGGGANYFSKRSKKIYTVKQGVEGNTLASNLVNTATEDDEYFWIGTEGGLDRVLKKDLSFKHYSYEIGNPKSLRRNPVHKLYVDFYNNLWVGLWDGGLCKYNRKTDDFTRYAASNEEGSLKSENVIAIHQDKKKRLWIGTSGGGFYKYDYSKDNFLEISKSKTNSNGVPVNNVCQIQDYDHETILFNTYHSINFYNPDTNYHKEYSVGSYLNTFPVGVICSFIDSRGNIWVGTNIGLFQFDVEAEKFSPFESNFKLDNIVINSIIEDKSNNIWVTSNDGVFNIDWKTKRITRLSKEDGFSTNDFKPKATFKSRRGILFFGTSKGFSYFDPKDISLNEKAPNLSITSFGILKSTPNNNNQYEYKLENLNPSQEIVLENDQSSFVVSFTGLNYLDPEKNKYKYKLEGYDKIWVDSGTNRTATYTNLEEGDYIFKVTGTNNDGLVSTAYKTIKILKKGPWYASSWFKILIGILLLLFSFLFYFIRLSIYRRQRKILRRKVEERTKDLKEVNNELFQHRNNLEDLVSKRTLELEKAKQKAEESDKLKTAFIANMSHEIRTPMNAIYGFSGLLGEDDIDDKEQGEYIEIIKENCESLLVLIDDILDISIMDAQGVQLNFQQVNLNEFLKHLETMFKQKEKPEAPIEYIRDSSSKEVFIKTDPIRLRQIFSNLLNNSIKFTEKGSIKFGYNLIDSNTITFYIKDTGIGISEKNLERIFKPFIKVGNHTEKLYRGTGIGLSISQRIAKSFKGKINVESELGEGATFYINLPI